MKRAIALLLAGAVAMAAGHRADRPAVYTAPPPIQRAAKEFTIQRLPTFNDALQWAEEDAMLLHPSSAPFVRWLWNRDGEYRRSAFGVNVISRGSTPLRLPSTFGGKLVRIDIRNYAPTDKDLVEWLAIWEKFEFDPDSSLLLTKDTLDNLPVPAATKKEWVFIDEDVTWNGVRYRGWWKQVEVVDTKNIVLVRQDARYVDQAKLNRLRRFTGSRCPVVSESYFLVRALASIREDGLYEQIWGGLYYDLAGIDRTGIRRGSSGSDEDRLFESVGIGDGTAGSAAKLLDRLRSDERVAVFRRNLNKKPSRIDWFGTPNSRLGLAAGVVFITHDLKDKDIEIGQHPVMNLVNFRDAAREVIFTKRNGMQGFALFDDKGKLLDEATIDVATDTEVPRGHSPRLQPAISCIRCHGPEDGWHPLSNDVKAMQDQRIKIFGDTFDLNRSIADTLDRLAGQYTGSPDKPLRRARDDYAEAVLRSTGPWKTSRDQTDVTKLASASIAEMWQRYWYDEVDAMTALKELGFRVSEGTELEVLQRLLPPDEQARDEFGIIREDPRIVGLKAGRKINRQDWSLIYGFAAERSERAWKAMTVKN